MNNVHDIKRKRNYRVIVARVLAIMVLAGAVMVPMTSKPADAQDVGCRTLSSLDAAGIFSRITRTAVPGVPIWVVRFTIRPEHGMSCSVGPPCNPNNVDGVFFRTHVRDIPCSSNIRAVEPVAPDPSRPGCILQYNVHPQLLNVGSDFCFRVKFQEFTLQGWNPKRANFILPLPPRDFPPAGEGVEESMLEEGTVVPTADDGDPGALQSRLINENEVLFALRPKMQIEKN